MASSFLASCKPSPMAAFSSSAGPSNLTMIVSFWTIMRFMSPWMIWATVLVMARSLGNMFLALRSKFQTSL